MTNTFLNMPSPQQVFQQLQSFFIKKLAVSVALLNITLAQRNGIEASNQCDPWYPMVALHCCSNLRMVVF